MAEKYIGIVNGALTEKSAVDTSSGAADAGKIPSLGADGRFANGFMPSNIGTPTITLPATEALAAGAIVSIYDNAGTASVRNANATDSTKPAHGFVLSAVTSGANATVYLSGEITGLTGLTTGSEYFLGATAGALTTTAPAATGNAMQSVGYAVNTSALVFAPKKPIIRA